MGYLSVKEASKLVLSLLSEYLLSLFLLLHGLFSELVVPLVLYFHLVVLVLDLPDLVLGADEKGVDSIGFFLEFELSLFL